MRNTIFQPRQTLITAEWLNAVDSIVFNSVSPYTYGALGDGVVDDYLALQNLINAIKKPGLNLTTSSSAKAALRVLSRVKVDLGGNTYLISKPLDFANTYNIIFCNGVIKAHPSWSGGSSPLLNVAAPQTADTYRDQHIRYVTFSDITVDGNGLANCMYLENTFNLVLNRVYMLGWPDGGKGLWTSSSTGTPYTKNTNLQINSCSFMQKDSAEFVGGGVTTSGTAVSLKNADFIVNGLITAFADVGLEIDWGSNSQVSNFHSYATVCLLVGANASNVSFSNIYMDTGLVQLRSFSHTFAAAQFIAGSTVQLIATLPNEDMGGLSLEGRFGNAPQFLTEGSGTWASSFNGRISGLSKAGITFPTRGGVVLGSQTASNPSLVFSTDSQVYNTTGFFSPAPNSLGYSLNGNERWRIDDTARWLLGYNTSVQLSVGTSPQIQLNSTTGNSTSISAVRWGSSALPGGRFICGRSHSDTIGTYSAVQAGDILGRYEFVGDSGTSLNNIGAYIKATANNNWTSSAASTYLTFATTQNGQTSPTDWWNLGQNGNFNPSGQNSIIFPGPYASDAAAATAGVSLNAAYRYTDGTIHWRQV